MIFFAQNVFFFNYCPRVTNILNELISLWKIFYSIFVKVNTYCNFFLYIYLEKIVFQFLSLFEQRKNSIKTSTILLKKNYLFCQEIDLQYLYFAFVCWLVYFNRNINSFLQFKNVYLRLLQSSFNIYTI